MDNFKRNNKFGERRNGGGFSGRSSERPSMHKAVCSACGRDCEVPFKPTGERPVFCNECFRNKKSAEQPRRFSQKDSARFNPSGKISDQASKQFEIINVKLDRILKAISPAISAEADEKKKISKSKGKKAVSPKKAKQRKKK